MRATASLNSTTDTANDRFRRWLLLFVGLVFFGVGIAIMVRSDLGLSPWETFHQGISRRSGVPIGAVSILVGIPVLLGWIPLRERPGIGTVLNILIIGIVTDFTLARLPVPHLMPVRLIWMVAGIVLIGIGSGFYLSAGFGAGPRDGLMMGLHRRTGRSIRFIRTVIEVSVLVAGWLMGGTVGIGTIAFAFGIGPIVQPVLRRFSRPRATR